MKEYNLQIIDLRSVGVWDTSSHDVGIVELEKDNFDPEVLRDNITSFANGTHGIALIYNFNCNKVLVLLVNPGRTDHNDSLHLVF